MADINLYSSKVHPRRVFPIQSWIEGISDFNKVGGSYLWARGVDYRSEPSQITLLPSSVLETGQATIADTGKWGEQVVGKTVTLDNSTNLIANPSFEVNTTGWTLGTDFTRSNGNAYLGTFSIKQVSTTGSVAFTTASGSPITVTQNADYELIFYTNVAITSGSGAHLQIQGGAIGGTNLLISDTVLNDTAGVWTPVSVTFNSGNFTSIFINIFNVGGSLTAYYDSFTFVQINSLATFVYGDTGNIYKRFSDAATVFMRTVPNSHGNGMAYYGEDDFLYYIADHTIGRYGPISSGQPTFTDDYLTAQGGVPTNTNSTLLVAADSQYWAKGTPTSALKVTSDIALEAFVKPTTLPAVGSSMTVMGLWGEASNHRGYKLDIFGISAVFGSGSDSSLTISTNTIDSPIDSACSGTINTNQLFANNASFAVGQKILILQMQGTGAGTKQQTTIQAYDSTNHIITTIDALNFSYNSSGNNTAQVLVQKQYTNVTINASVTLTAKAWNGTVGGVLGILASGTFTNNGALVADGCGFRGGATTTSASGQAFQGEGTGGPGIQSNVANGNGGGGGGNGGSGSVKSNAGGSGGNSATGTQGTASTSGVAGGQAGQVAGATDLSSITMGGAGGAGGAQFGSATTGTLGGNGGGIIFITAVNIVNNGTITSAGEPGTAVTLSDTSGGSAGAGGSILFRCQTATLGSLTATALGSNVGGSGVGSGNGVSGVGGASNGYCVVDYLTSETGTTTPTLNAIQDNTLVTIPSYQARLGISNDGTSFEYLTQNLQSLTPGQWDRLSVSWVAATSTASFYENAVLIGTSTGTKTSISASSADFAVGANVVSSYTNFFDGEINDVRVWNGQQTATQIMANNLVNLGGVASGLVGSWFLTATGNDLTSANNLVAAGSPSAGFVSDVPYSGATTRLDLDQTGGGTGHTFTLTAAISESSQMDFVPAFDPQKSVQVNISGKGTADWTLIVHNGLNQLIVSITVPIVNLPASGLYEFVFANVWRPVVGATYHFHIIQSSADGTVVTSVASDFTTTEFNTYYQFLVNDTEYHPVMQMINSLAIGNERYLAVINAAGGDGQPGFNAAGYLSRRLKLPAGWRIRCLATYLGFFAIGCWKGTAIKDFDQGIVFLWDGYSVTYNDFFYVPEGAVQAMYGENGTLYLIAGYKGDILEYTGGDSAVKVKRIPKVGKQHYVEVTPGGMTYWQALLRISVAYNSDSTTLERGVYTWGTYNQQYPKSLSYDYPISTGNRGTTVNGGALVPVGGQLLSCWGDGAAHGIDNINPNNPPQTSGTVEESITDFGIYWKNKQELTVRADHFALNTGENVDVKYKINYEASWHNLGLTSQKIGDTKTRYPLPTPNVQYHALQIAVDLYAANGTSPTVLEHSNDTDLLLTETDESATT